LTLRSFGDFSPYQTPTFISSPQRESLNDQSPSFRINSEPPPIFSPQVFFPFPLLMTLTSLSNFSGEYYLPFFPVYDQIASYDSEADLDKSSCIPFPFCFFFFRISLWCESNSLDSFFPGILLLINPSLSFPVSVNCDSTMVLFSPLSRPGPPPCLLPFFSLYDRIPLFFRDLTGVDSFLGTLEPQCVR